jgi:transcriptional regulator with XRE-family HTH domain
MDSIILEALRKSKDSKSAIARKMGVSRAYITQLLSGDKNLTFRTASDFCRCCGFDLNIKLKRINTSKKIPDSPPDSMRWLFWDADFSRIDPVEHKGYILQRILDRGDTEAVKWMRKEYSRRQIIGFINRNQSKLDARSLNFWALIYGKEEKWAIPSALSNESSWRKLESVNL